MAFWVFSIAFGVVLIVFARPLAVRTANSYRRVSPETRAKWAEAQTHANRIGGGSSSSS